LTFSSETTTPGHTRLSSSPLVTSAPSASREYQDIEGARAELDRNAVGEQLPPAQQNPETAEFEIRAGGCAVRGVYTLRTWVSAPRRLWTNIWLHLGFPR